jgi:tetratricopeptide (TPR) repeat protein
MALARLAGRSRDPDVAGPLVAEAVGLLDESAAIYRRLTGPGAFPRRPDYRLKLAQADRSRGILLFNQLGKVDAAEAAFRDSVATLGPLAGRYPEAPEYQAALGTSLQNLALLQSRTGRAGDARRSADGAIAHQRAALATNPKDLYSRKYLLDAYAVLAAALEPLGDHAGAAAAGEAVAAQLPDDPRADVSSARFFDLAATLAIHDAALPRPERDERSRALAGSALEHLRKAVRDRANLLPKDLDPPAFDAIRAHSPGALEALQKAIEARLNPAVG